MNRAIDMKYVQSSGTRALGFVVAAILLAADAGLAGDRDMKVLDDFSDASTGGRWTTVNDDVMGGVSTGEITVRGDGTLIFFGKTVTGKQGRLHIDTHAPRKPGSSGIRHSRAACEG